MPKFDITEMYAYLGGSKPKKAKVKTYQSAYDGVNQSSMETPFASGWSGKEGNSINTRASLSPGLQAVNDTATTGLNNNLSYLSMNPNQRVSYLTSGKDPMYNVLKENADKDLAAAIGRNAIQAQKFGRSNSTSAGAAMGAIQNNDMLRRNQMLLSSLNYGNENARADAGIGLNTIGGLSSLVYPLATGANNNLLQAFNQQDTAAARNTAAQNAAEAQYAADMNAYNQRKAGSLGSLIGTGASALTSFLGGGGIASMAPAMSGMFGGGQQAPASPTVYAPDSGGFGSLMPMPAQQIQQPFSQFGPQWANLAMAVA